MRNAEEERDMGNIVGDKRQKRRAVESRNKKGPVTSRGEKEKVTKSRA